MLRRILKKRVIAAFTVVAVLAVAGVAVAYFTSSGTGTGTATVGTSSGLTVNPVAATGGPLYPGSGTEVIGYTVSNPATGSQSLQGTTAVVASSGGNITSGGVAVPGCLASWFTAINTAPTPLPQDLAGGATSTAGSVSVTMQDVNSSQDLCKSTSPDITISAS